MFNYSASEVNIGKNCGPASTKCDNCNDIILIGDTICWLKGDPDSYCARCTQYRHDKILDVLQDDTISRQDKHSMLECYKKHLEYKNCVGHERSAGDSVCNTTIVTNGWAMVYRVNIDKTITFITCAGEAKSFNRRSIS